MRVAGEIFPPLKLATRTGCGPLAGHGVSILHRNGFLAEGLRWTNRFSNTLPSVGYGDVSENSHGHFSSDPRKIAPARLPASGGSAG